MPQQPHVIEVFLNPFTHKLRVNPDPAEVTQGESVVWIIRTGQNISWIQVGTNGHPFTPTLPSGDWNRFVVTVRDTAPVGDWKYSVKYKMGGNIKTIDPKISVKPKKHFTFPLAFMFVAACVTFVGVDYLLKEK